MSKILYTFIIPLYNKDGNMILRCLNSIPKRDDIQIIIVDDHSPSYYDEHNSIKVEILERLPFYGDDCVSYFFLPKNEGPGNARNFGITKAKGKWLFFLDADDYYDKNLLEALLNYSKCTDSELILFGHNYIGQILKKEKLYGLDDHKGDFFQIYSQAEKELLIKVMFPWSRMIKKSLIERIDAKFDKLYLSEDRLFCVNTFLSARNIFFFAEPVYNYSYVPNSLSNNVLKLSKILPAIDIAIKVNRIYKKYGILGRVYDDTLWMFMYSLNKLSPVRYWWCLLNVFICFDKNMVSKIRFYVCAKRQVHVNLYRQFINHLFNK